MPRSLLAFLFPATLDTRAFAAPSPWPPPLVRSLAEAEDRLADTASQNEDLGGTTANALTDEKLYQDVVGMVAEMHIAPAVSGSEEEVKEKLRQLEASEQKVMFEAIEECAVPAHAMPRP